MGYLHTEDTLNSIDAELAPLQEKVLYLKRRRNAVTAIAKLPPELISAIFHLSLSFEPKSARYRIPDCIKLCHICHAWRELALGCTELWTHIQVQMGTPNALLDFMLENSKEGWLNFELTGRSQHMSRMAGFEGPLALKSMQDLFRYTPDRFASLSIRSDTELMYQIYGRDGPVEFRAPNLRRLELWGLALPWTTPVFRAPKLTHLTLHHAIPCRQSTLSELHALLLESPQLQLLDITLNMPTYGDAELPSIDRSVQMAKMRDLQTLHLRTNVLPLMSLVLSFFTLPSSIMAITLHSAQLNVPPHEHRTFWESCARTFKTGLSPNILRLNNRRGEVFCATHTHSSSQPWQTVSIKTGDTFPLSNPNAHSPTLSFENLYSALIFHPNTISSTFWDELSALTSLGTIELETDEIDSVLEALRQDDCEVSAPFPALETLTFNKTSAILDAPKYRSLAGSVSASSFAEDVGGALRSRMDGGPCGKLRFLKCLGAMDFAGALNPDAREVLESVAEEVEWVRWSYGQ